MDSRTRVTRLIRHETVDRMPLYGWVSLNMRDKIESAFGTVETFEDHYEFDLAHLFGGPLTFRPDQMDELRDSGRGIEPSDILDAGMTDPDDTDSYSDIIRQIEHHRARGRFLYVQTPGILEQYSDYIGMEHHMMDILLYPDEMHEIYRRQVSWTQRFIHNCLDLGIDMIHVSDDWGSQNSLLISPAHWRDMIFPYHRMLTETVKQRGAFVSLHSDGYITDVLDGIAELGYDVIHPFQESAGMGYDLYDQRYRDAFVLMGGIDIQTTLGFDNIPKLKSEIDRVVHRFRDGGLILCTSHFVQDHCSLEELVYAFDLAYSLIRNER